MTLAAGRKSRLDIFIRLVSFTGSDFRLVVILIKKRSQREKSNLFQVNQNCEGQHFNRSFDHKSASIRAVPLAGDAFP